MSQTLSINNYGQSNLLEQTRLRTPTTAGDSSLDVLNTAGIVAADYITIGTLGSDTTEMLIVSSIVDQNTISPVGTAQFDHPAYEYVNKLFGNQVRIYSAPNTNGLQPADVDFAPLATIDIEFDKAYTEYTDVGGDSGFWYKFTYYNSTTDDETNLSDSKAVRGGSTGDYCSIAEVRQAAGFANAPYVTDPMIDLKRQAAQDEINGTLAGFYEVPFTVPINPFISDICVRLASGLLLVDQYSAISTTNTADGENRIKLARADLETLATKQKVLVDANGQNMAQSGSTGGISGWPNSSTATTLRSDGGAPRQFRMGDIGTLPSGRPGYTNRRY